MSTQPAPDSPRYLLWKYFHDEHKLTLVETELSDVIHEVEKYRQANPTPSPDKLAAQAETPRYYWKQCYEINDGEYHWALCDTASASETPSKVSCAYMVLLASYPNGIDGKPVGEQWMPKRIVDLLNGESAAVARILSENKRLHESLDFQGRGDVPKGWDAAIARAEAANQQLTHLKAELERANGLLVEATRNVAHTAQHPAGEKSRHLLKRIESHLNPKKTP